MFSCEKLQLLVTALPQRTAPSSGERGLFFLVGQGMIELQQFNFFMFQRRIREIKQNVVEFPFFHSICKGIVGVRNRVESDF